MADKVIGPAFVAVIWSNRIFSLHVLLGLLVCPVFISPWLRAPFLPSPSPSGWAVRLIYLGLPTLFIAFVMSIGPFFVSGLILGFSVFPAVSLVLL